MRSRILPESQAVVYRRAGAGTEVGERGEVELLPALSFPRLEEQALAILRHVDLEGPHTLYGIPDANQLVMIRMCATGHYRVSCFRRNRRWSSIDFNRFVLRGHQRFPLSERLSALLRSRGLGSDRDATTSSTICGDLRHYLGHAGPATFWADCAWSRAPCCLRSWRHLCH